MTTLSHSSRRLPLIVLLLVAILAGPALARAQSPIASPAAQPTAGNLYADIIPSEVDAVRLATGGQLPIYRISATLTPPSDGPALIEGSLQLSYINVTDESQDAIALRLYPNYVDWGDGSMDIDDVTVDGVAADVTVGDDLSLAMIALPKPLAPGERADLSLTFETRIPVDPQTNYSMFGYFSDTDSYNLAQWMPLLAGWDPATGWLLGPLTSVGDPVFSNAAMWEVELTAPTTITFVTSGKAVDATVDGANTTHTLVAGPTRDFVMTAGTNLQALEQQVGETTVRSWYFPGDDAAAKEVLTYGTDSLRLYSDAFGVYPYTELDLAETNLGPQAAGIEFPGLVYIGAVHYQPGNDYLQFTTVHEVAHQWWYGIVGNNQYLHAFIDEAMANESSMIYKEALEGTAAYEAWVDDYLTRPFLSMLFGQDGDMIVDQPTANFLTNGPYGRAVYGKGALGFDRIRQAIGDDAFLTGLQQYVADHRFGVAQPEDMLAALEAASGQDLQGLWDHWFHRTEGTQDFGPEDLMG